MGKTREQLSVAPLGTGKQPRVMQKWRGLTWLLCVLLIAGDLRAWDYERHRLINDLALGTLPKDFPRFALTPAARERILFLGGEPDRWRNNRERACGTSTIPTTISMWKISSRTRSNRLTSVISATASWNKWPPRARPSWSYPRPMPTISKGRPGFLPGDQRKLPQACQRVFLFESVRGNGN